ncbi:hypothetical protein [Leucobacter sp. W1478]
MPSLFKCTPLRANGDLRAPEGVGVLVGDDQDVHDVLPGYAVAA